MSGGTLNVANALNVGWDGVGLFTLNGGTVNCLSLAVDGSANTGAIGGTNETFSLTGGRINIGIGGITTVSTDGGYGVLLGGGTVGANGNWSSSLNLALTNGPRVTFDTADRTITLTGLLSGTNGLTKQGSGYLNLNHATNTFSGPVTVAQGTLQGSGTVSGPVTVQSSAALSAGTTAATGTLTVSNHATFNPGSMLVIDAATTAATSDRVDVRGTLALDPAGTTAYFNFLGGRPFTGGAYTVVSNLVPRTGSLTVFNPTRYAAAVDETNPNRIQVTFTGTNAALTWKGNVNSLWNLNGTANWLNGAVASTYYQSDAVIFEGTGLSAPNVTLAAELSPASITVNAAGDYTFAGAGLAGLGSLAKSGSGKLTLANNNPNFLGATTVGFGTLQIGNGGVTGSLPGNIINNSSVVFNRSDAMTYAGVMSASGTLTQAGGGKLTLIGANSYQGGTLINAGTTLQVGAGLNAGVAGLGPINVAPGGSLGFYRNDSPTIANQLTGAGAINFLGTGQTGAGSGQSSYTLSASNTFSGTVTLSQTRLNPSSAFALGSVGTFVVPVNSTLWPNVAGAVFTPALNLAGSGWPENAGYLGALRFGSGCTWAGPITLSGDTRISALTDANDNRLTGTITGGNYIADFGAPGGGAGVLTLAPSAPNTFGALRLSPGTLIAANANAVPNGKPLIMNGGTLRLNGLNFTTPSYQSLANGTIQNSSSTAPAYFNFTSDPLVSAAIGFGALGETGTQPLHVTWIGAGVAITMATASPTWTGNFTNFGGTMSSGVGGTFGAMNLPGRTLAFNNATINLTINNALSGGTATMPTFVFSNTTVNATRFNALGPVFLNASTLTGNIGSGAAGMSFFGHGFTLTKVGANQITFRPELATNIAPLVISGGTLNHEGFNRTNVSTLTTTNYVNPNAVLTSYGTLTLNYPVVFRGGSFDNQNSTATWTGPFALESDTVATVGNPINLWGNVSGPGALVKLGLSILTLSNANTYAGGTIISNAPVTATNSAPAVGVAGMVVSQPTALGSGPVTLDLTQIAVGTATNTARPLEFNITGGGVVPNAIILPGAGMTNVSLHGRNATSIYTLAGKLSGGHAFLTNWFDNATGNVGVTRLSNPANDFLSGRIYVNRGTLALTADGALGNSANFLNQAANTTVRFDAPGFNLAHGISATANPTYLDMFGDNDGNGVPETAHNVTVSGLISGAGAIFPRGTNGTMTLTGNNPFTGGFELQPPLTLQVAAAANLGPSAYVAVKAGSTFRYTGTGSETMTRALWMDSLNGGTLAGNGTINGPTTVQVGGILAPGVGGIGLLTLPNALNLGGSAVMELNQAGNTNDSIVSVSSINYGGSLVVNNLGGTLLAGDTFKLFTAWAYFGSFASTTLPTLTAGLAWDTTGLLVDGTIKVVSVAPPALAGAAVLPDGNFQLTLTGTVGQGYKILASSDVAAPLNTWTVLQTGTLPTATYQYTDLTATNYAYRFYATSTP